MRETMRRRITAAICSAAALIGVYAPVGHAALGIDNELEVSLMAALDIVPGYPTTYAADAPVTREQFIEYAYAAVGVDDIDGAAYAASYGFGDGSEQIKASEAAEVMIDVSGYKPIMETENRDAIEFARSRGLFSGVAAVNADTGITTESAAVIIYNTLGLSAIEVSNNEYTMTDETVMEDKLGVYKKTGIVTGNNETSLSGCASAARNHVTVDGDPYSAGNTAAADFLGCDVTFYYKEGKSGDEDVIKWIEVNDSKTVKTLIYGCDISGIEGNRITYESRSGSDKTVTVSKDADVIYNGVRSDEYTAASLEWLASKLTSETTLIENSSSNDVSVIIVNDYEYYFVDSYTASTYTVNDYAAGTSIILDESDYTTLNIYKDGVLTTSGSIMKGQVLAVTESEDKNVVRVEIITGSVSGEITTYNSDRVTIGGTIYYISPAYAGDQLKMGRTGTFYFDKLGKIVRCATERGQNSRYGYLMMFFSNGDGTSDFVARILTAEGAVQEFNVKNSLSFNGSKKAAKAVETLLWDGQDYEQLITYTVNGENMISSIDTADSKYIGVDEAYPDEFTYNFEGSGRYRKNNMSFNSKYMVDSSTPIFLIPYNGETDEYSVRNVSYLTNGQTYSMSVYDIDDYMYAGAIVLHESIIEPENLRKNRSVIITDVVESIDDDNEVRTMIEGYQKGSKVSYFIDNENMLDNRGNTYVKDLRAGDVIQVGLNSKDRINAVQILFKSREHRNRLTIAGGTDTPNEYWEGGTSIFPDLWVSTGNVTDRNTDVILVDSDGDDTVVSKKPHKLGSCATYIYDNEEITVSNKNEISVGDIVFVQEYQGTVWDIVIVRDGVDDE